MSVTRRIITRDGKTWYVGDHLELGGETDSACVLIPADQVEGLSDRAIGRAVRESIQEARFCQAEYAAHHIIMNVGTRQHPVLPQSALDQKPLLLAFAGKSASIDRALAIIIDCETRRERPSTRRSRRDRSGYIYLVEGPNCYKIGKSVDVPSRTRSFGLQLPFPTTLIHSIPTSDMVWAEASMHRTFAHCRMNGEWFDLSPDEVAWICDLDSLDPDP